MISCTDKQGRTVLLGTPESLKTVIEWMRSVLHTAYGPEEGERRLHKIPAEALSLWSLSSPVTLDLSWATPGSPRP